jgi:uncharacterized protein YjbI with pentapeptide repeats
MANREQLELLKEGIDAWNDWREKNPDVQPNLEDADLQGLNLCKANFKGILLRRANLQNANLCEANLTVLVKYHDTSNDWVREAETVKRTDLSNIDLRGANLSKADLRGSCLIGADLRGANLDGTRLTNYSYYEFQYGADNGSYNRIRTELSSANLSGLDLTKAVFYIDRDNDSPSFEGANLSDANLSGANFSGANLEKANLSDANFSGANLSRANLWSANLQKLNLTKANLSEADLSKANLTIVNLSEANFSGANLRRANLQEVDLQKLNLTKTNLSKANLQGTNLRNADLSMADLREANLKSADLQGSNLTEANLKSAILDNIELAEANLTATDFSRRNFQEIGIRRATLKNAVLSDAYLSGKDLSEINLSGSDLSRVNALETDFSRAILTGACIEDWHTNSTTKLDGVICDFIYLRSNQHERRPHDPNKIFAQGEFAKLFQKAIETVDLIFRNGINWEAFAYSFQQFKVKIGTQDTSIQAIENKGDGNFVIRVNAPLGLDKVEIQRFIEREYQEMLKTIETTYRTQLQAKDEQLEIFRRENTNLWEIAKLMASRPINVEAKTMVDKQYKSVEVEMNFQATVIGATGVNKGVININASEQQKTLAESAAEIQRLLKQLEDTNPSATEPEQIAYVNLATKPNFKQRAVTALREGGEVAIEEFFLENKYLKVGKAVIKGWLQGNA